MIRVLAVAVNVSGLPQLATSEELSRIGDVPGVSLRTLTDATAQRIAHRLSLEPFDVFLLIGHGGPGYVVLQDGHIDPQWLAAQLSSRGVQVAVIATCNSAGRPEASHATMSFADALPASGIDTITMMTDVGDRAAIEYDVALLQSLATSSTVRVAHQVGIAAAARHGGVKAPLLTPRDGDRLKSDASDPTISGTTMDRLDTKMDRVLKDLHDIDTRVRLLEDGLKRLEAEVKSSPGYSRVYLAGGMVVGSVMLLLLLFVTWRLM